MFSLIAAIGKNRELGKQGRLIFEIPEDMQFFKETTMGHKVLMGRKTWESLLDKLQGRENIVVSRHEVIGADRVVNDLAEFIEINKDTKDKIFVIGGGEIYREVLPYAREIYLTEVEAEVSEADTWFPKFDYKRYDREIIKKRPDYTIVKYTLMSGVAEGSPPREPSGGRDDGRTRREYKLKEEE